MHDAKGRPLKEGDRVLIPGRITSTCATDEFCNVTVESLIGRRPDGSKETFSGFNAGVVLRANDGDGAPDLSDEAIAELPVRL